MHGRVHIGEVADDERIHPAHFQREDFSRLPGEGPVNGLSCNGAAGEKHAVNLWMRGQCHTGVARALQQIQHAARQPRLMPQFCGGSGNGGCQFGGLEHHTVAGNQGRHNMPIGQMPRKIIGTEHRHHTVRAMPQYHPGIGTRRGFFAGALVIRFDANLHLGNHAGDLSHRLPQWFAGFMADDVRHVVLLLTQQRGELPDNFQTRGQRGQ